MVCLLCNPVVSNIKKKRKKKSTLFYITASEGGIRLSNKWINLFHDDDEQNTFSIQNIKTTNKITF